MIAIPAILSLARRYWPFAAIGVLAFALGIQTARISHIKGKHAQYVAAAEKARADAAARVIAIERESARISQERDASHAKAIDDLRSSAARRLQSYTGKPAALPVVPRAPIFAHEGTGGVRLCVPTAAIVSLMLAADENTQQLVDLQSWIRREIENRQ